jgi:cobalt/nickel transport system permease protein
MIGSLFIRTYDRGNRIHGAMLARGYGGDLPIGRSAPLPAIDRMFLTLLGLFAVLGQLVYWNH